MWNRIARALARWFPAPPPLVFERPIGRWLAPSGPDWSRYRAFLRRLFRRYYACAWRRCLGGYGRIA